MGADAAALDKSRVEVADEGSGSDTGAYSFRGSAKLLLASGTGRAAIALFILLLAISANVMLTYPLHFGPERWSNPTIWADNPKTVPPFWMKYLGTEGIEHKSFKNADPDAVSQRGAAEVRDYNFPLSIDSDVTPTFLSMTLTGITFNSRAPFVQVTLVRPDGGQIRLANIAVPGPREGETAPYHRYYDTPERILLTQQDTAASSITQWYAQQYPGLAYPTDLSTT